MKFTKKTFALLLVGALCVAAFTGCKPAANSTSSEAVSSEPESYLTDEAGKPIVVEKIVTIGGTPISLEEYRYYFFNTKANFEAQLGQISGGVDIWAENPEMLNYVKEDALMQVQTDYVIRKYAADNGYTLTEEDKKLIDENLVATVEQMGGQQAFQDRLTAMYLQEELFRSVLELDVIKGKLQEEMATAVRPTDEDAKKEFEENFLHAKHILVKTEGITDETELAKKKEIADAALKRARAGEDFDALVKEYGEDPGMQSMPEGYYFGEGEMMEEFYNGAKALKVNDISEPIQTAYGLHIIQRLPIEETYFETNKTDIINKMLQKKMEPEMAKLNTKLDAIAQTMAIEKTPEYELIGIANFK